MYKIPIQSISDVITNSSSEIFLRISSEKYIYSIADLLNQIFPKHCRIHVQEEEFGNEDLKYIDFEVELGAFDEDSKLKDQFTAAIEYIINNKGYKNEYTINTEVCL